MTDKNISMWKVDLEEECKIYLKNNFTSKEAPDEFLTTLMQLDDMIMFAKHFYKLGFFIGVQTSSIGEKEVDLEEAISGLTVGWIEGEEYGELQNINTARCVTLEEVKEVMRCVYELGLKAKKGE